MEFYLPLPAARLYLKHHISHEIIQTVPSNHFAPPSCLLLPLKFLLSAPDLLVLFVSSLPHPMLKHIDVLNFLSAALTLLQNGIPVRIIAKEETFHVGQRGAGISVRPPFLRVRYFINAL